MKSGVPWNVLGVSPETRDVAREAARRSGMPLGEWLDTIIGESTREEGAGRRSYGRRAEEEGTHASDHNIGRVNQRLDEITRQLDRLASGRSAAPPPPRQHDDERDDPTSQRLADVIARLDSRLVQLLSEDRLTAREIDRHDSTAGQPPAAFNHAPTHANGRHSPTGIDQAVAEIAARQRELNGEPPVAHVPMHTFSAAYRADPVPRSPTQDVSRLEQQLRQITERIATLNRPCAFEDAAGPLRAQLSEIAQMLNDAMPRRALEALENEVRRLAERIDQTRQSGADTAAISGIEHGLAEVRDALRTLTPAESLVGLDSAVNVLSQKIDLIAATHQDPEALRQLEAAIAGLHGVVSHVASDDALARLAEEVRGLADKIDGVAATGGGDALMALEHRIGTLTNALESRQHGGEALPPQIDAIVNALSEKIESVQLSRGDHVALGHLENRIAMLVERLDASDARLGNLEAIERGLVDLLVHLEEMRASTMRPGGPRAESDASQPATDSLDKEIAELKQADARTKDTLEDVHGTIGHVVERLAKIEQDVRVKTEPPPAPESPAPESDAAEKPPADNPVPVAAPAPAPAAATTTVPVQPEQPAAPPAAAPAPATPPQPAVSQPPTNAVATRHPIDPNLPPDHPLEPGSGSGRGRNPVSAADRVAASEAALAPAKPPVIPDPGGKPDFIAAARRAAQAAAAEKPERASVQSEPYSQTRVPISERLGKRMRSLFVGAAVAIIAIGALHVAKNFLMEAEPEISELPSGKSSTDANVARPDAPAASPVTAEPPPAAATPQLGETPATPPSATSVPPAGVLNLGAPPPATPPSQPDRKAAPAAAPDITGSVPLPPIPPAATRSTNRPPEIATPEPETAQSTLPAKIGGKSLRVAAAKGDAAAAYEVASRYAEGRRIRRNLKEAARWFEQAAKGGLAPAQFRLGALYEKGQGVRKDLNEARRLYTAAAEKGHGKAMHNLAVLYAEGIDGKPAYGTAAQWFRKAADHGVADSQYNLGILYARGIGVGQNLAESYKWFALAARAGDKEAAKKRDDVAGRLDQQSLTAARLAVQTWTATPEPAAATEVKAPPGGWDRSAAPAKPYKRKHG